jgi:hypothetical protein
MEGVIMKNIIKFVFVILAFCFIAFLISCVEKGGTIIINNNYSEDKMVTVYSDFSLSLSMFFYKDKYGPQNIVAGGTGNFSVKSDALYGIIWKGDKYDEVITVKVSNGETVEVKIP